MAKVIPFGKKHSLFVAESVLFLAFLGLLLWIDLSFYNKLIFLSLLLLTMGLMLGFLQIRRRYQILIKNQRQNIQKLDELSGLALEFSKISFIRNKASAGSVGPELASMLAHLFEEYFQSDKFILFVKKRKVYQALIAHNITLPQRNKISIKANSQFISLLRSTEGLQDIDLVQSLKVPSSFRSLRKQHGLNHLIPLSTRSDLLGFVIFSGGVAHKEDDEEIGSKTEKASSAETLWYVKQDWERRLALFVLNQIAQHLEKEELEGKLKELENKFNTETKQIKVELSALSKDLKRKVFDLNAISGLVKNLYSVLDEEGLFSTLARMLQDHLGAKSIFLMLPKKETQELMGRYFYGAHTPDIFGEETRYDLKIERDTALYNWIKNEKHIWPLYQMERISREEKLLQALLNSGFQIGAKLSFDRNSFGVIFLGEKTDGAKYRQIDLDILTILVHMTVIAYKNIQHFKCIEELSYTDSITGLYNYRYFYKRLTEEVFRAKRFGRKLALVIFDIDDFKIYNDTYGHQAGDQLLKQLGELLSRTVRSIDVVSRYGGEEFCVIMPESDQEECLKFAERLRKNIMNFPFKDEYQKQEHNITVSLGGAIYPYDARSVDRLIYCADMALLKAKSTGKNRSVMYQEKLISVSQ